MADYERNTVLPGSRVLQLAEEILTSRAGLDRKRQNDHGAVYGGGEGAVEIEAHRHGTMTTVTVRTDRLRTSKVDTVVRHFLNQLPYQPSDPEREY